CQERWPLFFRKNQSWTLVTHAGSVTSVAVSPDGSPRRRTNEHSESEGGCPGPAPPAACYSQSDRRSLEGENLKAAFWPAAPLLAIPRILVFRGFRVRPANRVAVCEGDSHAVGRTQTIVLGGEEASGPVPAAGSGHRAWVADGESERPHPEALALQATE